MSQLTRRFCRAVTISHCLGGRHYYYCNPCPLCPPPLKLYTTPFSFHFFILSLCTFTPSLLFTPILSLSNISLLSLSIKVPQVLFSLSLCVLYAARVSVRCAISFNPLVFVLVSIADSLADVVYVSI